MSSDRTLITFSGSLRSNSYNQKVAKQAQQIALELGYDAININLADYPLPLFNEDIENTETPASLNDLRRIFSSPTSILIASPEYNGSFSAALKNTLDWLSRPDNSDSNVYQPPFNRFTVALTAASPGSLGGLRGLGQLREVMTNLGSLVIPQQLAIGAAYEAFNEEGKLVNQETVDRLTGLVKTLLETDQRLQK
ncbi:MULTISPECIES: NADPH-dependent FMN reductase [unclassified Oleiphilus]|jgi:NAD(P)H-dependent FMN reductase|uniref:NADPH-dependent FMN reductase n=5 Tax=Oleiphilus TaxID=141450 RepID=UPI0007C40BFB|nr:MULTISPECIES: NADPH-dependent FMN reductase [unclassified Oleiphilus]KZY50243.1 hypothetical protein A3732_04785 [Oleiphilus sp. HI0050]KZY73745.1 hypothetical protein A3740_18265 [Oleiphilus sp. HI0068]KZY75634.1 hypothetical protein A3741_11880 [Oleiphilus sp. HI0069]KZZ20910.1 hypothetical protein A3749_18530 [Oleiphilus sp. HI0078]KZZ21314.1 hypothetical protein A3752_09300 [Oleiphilus sp. HI0081]KZZ40989.1 hypothetical protein A3755_04105 [Oleiphilus sp. HI0085]